MPGQSALKRQEVVPQEREVPPKENFLRRGKKSVRFTADESDWQSSEIKKLEARVTELLVTNEELRGRLEQKRYDEVYRENEMLKLELKNMYALQEENNDLREDLQRQSSLTYEERMKEVMEENGRLRRRNGELIIKLSDLEEQVAKGGPDLDREAQMAHLRH